MSFRHTVVLLAHISPNQSITGTWKLRLHFRIRRQDLVYYLIHDHLVIIYIYECSFRYGVISLPTLMPLTIWLKDDLWGFWVFTRGVLPHISCLAFSFLSWFRPDSCRAFPPSETLWSSSIDSGILEGHHPLCFSLFVLLIIPMRRLWKTVAIEDGGSLVVRRIVRQLPLSYVVLNLWCSTLIWGNVYCNWCSWYLV